MITYDKYETWEVYNLFGSNKCDQFPVGYHKVPTSIVTTARSHIFGLPRCRTSALAKIHRASTGKTPSGWWFQPLWKIWKSVGITIPNINICIYKYIYIYIHIHSIWKHETCSKLPRLQLPRQAPVNPTGAARREQWQQLPGHVATDAVKGVEDPEIFRDFSWKPS